MNNTQCIIRSWCIVDHSLFLSEECRPHGTTPLFEDIGRSKVSYERRNLLNEADLLGNLFDSNILLLVEDDLVLLEHILPCASMETIRGPNSFTLQHHRVSGIPSSSQ